MRVPRRIPGSVAVTAIAITGASLVGVGVHGVLNVDGELAAAVQVQQRQTHEVRYDGVTPSRPDCPRPATLPSRPHVAT